jgi:hypothetical protein
MGGLVLADAEPDIRGVSASKVSSKCRRRVTRVRSHRMQSTHSGRRVLNFGEYSQVLEGLADSAVGQVKDHERVQGPFTDWGSLPVKPWPSHSVGSLLAAALTSAPARR